MANWLEKIKGAVLPRQRRDADDFMTPAELLEAFTCHFRYIQNRFSVGTQMMFHTTYYVSLHPSDYKELEQALLLTVPQIVSRFYREIRRKKGRYPNYLPIANAWSFTFFPSESVARSAPPDIIGRLYPEKSDIAVPVNNHIVGTRPSPYGRKRRMPMDPQTAREQLDIIMESDCVVPPIAMPFRADLRLRSEQPYAALEYTGGREPFEMRDKLIRISGGNETRTSPDVLVINDESLAAPHVAIKYQSWSKSFSIAFFAKTIFGKKYAEISSSVAFPKWTPIHDGSVFFLGDRKFTFNVKNGFAR